MQHHFNSKASTLCFHRWTRKRFAIFASLHKVVKIAAITCTCTLIPTQTSTLSAQNKQEKDTLNEVDLDAIEVTGSVPLAVPQTTRNLQVVSTHEILSSPAQGLGDLLETLPGLDIRQRGNEVQSDISIRGGSFDQVLILLNGANITDPQTGHFNLDLPVSPDNIQRIEVLQGSAARLWGSNAFSGVINIVTKQPLQPNKTDLIGSLSYGSFGQLNGSLGVGKHWDKLSSSIHATYKRSDGYRPNTDYESLGAQFEAGFSDKQTGDLHFQLGFQRKGFGANSFYTFDYPDQFEATQTYSGSLGWQKTLGKVRLLARWNERLHHDRFELFRNGENAASWYTGHNYHLNRVSDAIVQVTTITAFGKSSLGLEGRRERILSNVLGEPLATAQTDPFDARGSFTKDKTRDNLRLFADQTVYWNKLVLSGGLSVNLNSDVPTFTTGGIDASFRLNKHWNLQANWNRAFRLPTFNDLYYKSREQRSNPNLKPEQSQTTELILNYTNGAFKGGLSTFYREGKNVIDWVLYPDSVIWLNRNETQINAFGTEIVLEYKPSDGFIRNIRLSQTYLTLNKEAQNYDSKYALDYLRFKTGIRLEHRVWGTQRCGFVSAVWNFAHQDRAGTYSKFKGDTPKRYAPFSMLDVKLNWNRSNWNVFLTGKNLTNTAYDDIGGLTQPGKSVLAGLLVTL